MNIQKWNYETHEYEAYSIENGLKLSLYESNMDTIINCPHCKKELAYGDGYTSLELHNDIGLGYVVCGSCYDEEWERKSRFAKVAQCNG